AAMSIAGMLAGEEAALSRIVLINATASGIFPSINAASDAFKYVSAKRYAITGRMEGEFRSARFVSKNLIIVADNVLSYLRGGTKRYGVEAILASVTSTPGI